MGGMTGFEPATPALRTPARAGSVFYITIWRQALVKPADSRASFAKLKELVGALHVAGIPIVAGTDGFGVELVRKLELYVDAGLTPAEALATATIAPAHLVGTDAHTGSISVGKAADLVLVDGNPSKNIGDLRHTRIVMMDGDLMDADALRAAGGFDGRPQ
jgi:imidazolonepropionase-like amidohydrolase